MRQLEINGFRGQRQVIDVSGDGRTNQGPHRITSYNVCYTKLLRRAVVAVPSWLPYASLERGQATKGDRHAAHRAAARLR